jgi:hypothetical protein
VDNYYLIHSCDVAKFRLFLNFSNSDVSKKFLEINRNPVLTNKFAIVVEAVKKNVANKSQWNWEGSCALGDIYAIKVSEHRFYTLIIKGNSYRELFISRYGKKQSESNDKALTDIIDSIAKIQIQKQLS